MAQVDWIKIKNEYINTNISQRKLSEKYQIPYQTIRDRAIKEKWFDKQKIQRSKIEAKLAQKTAEKIVTARVTYIDKILSLSQKATEYISDAMKQLKDENGNIDTYKLRQLVQSLKDLKELAKDDKTNEMKQKEEHDELMAALRKRNEIKQTK